MEPFLSKKKYRCKDCIYIFDPSKGDRSQGIKPGVSFEDLPIDWTCPICNANKKRFSALKN